MDRYCNLTYCASSREPQLTKYGPTQVQKGISMRIVLNNGYNIIEIDNKKVQIHFSNQEINILFLDDSVYSRKQYERL